jgi:hypothetical protein
MAGAPRPIDKSGNFRTVRKDQRFPPRYHKRADQQQKLGPGMSAVQILRKVGKVQLQNSKYVRIKRVQYNERSNLYKFTTETYDPETKQYRIHIQRIYPADREYKGKLSECPAIKVTCSCGNYLFCAEVALSYHNAADIIYSDGSYPIIKNPSLKPQVCKHLLKDLLFLVQKGL